MEEKDETVPGQINQTNVEINAAFSNNQNKNNKNYRNFKSNNYQPKPFNNNRGNVPDYSDRGHALNFRKKKSKVFSKDMCNSCGRLGHKSPSRNFRGSFLCCMA